MSQEVAFVPPVTPQTREETMALFDSLRQSVLDALDAGRFVNVNRQDRYLPGPSEDQLWMEQRWTGVRFTIDINARGG